MIRIAAPMWQGRNVYHDRCYFKNYYESALPVCRPT